MCARGPASALTRVMLVGAVGGGVGVRVARGWGGWSCEPAGGGGVGSDGAHLLGNGRRWVLTTASAVLTTGSARDSPCRRCALELAVGVRSSWE